MSALNSLVSEAIDVVVHCVRTRTGPRVGSIIAVENLVGTIDGTAFTTTDVFVRDNLDSPLRWSGLIPARLERAFAENGLDLRCTLDPTGVPPPMIPLLLAVTAGFGVFLLYSALSLGWSGLGLGPRIGSTSRSHTGVGTLDVDVWLQQASLEGTDKREFFVVVAALFVVGFLLAYAAFGGALPALAIGAFAASFPVASYRWRRINRRQRAQEAWPRMIEEIRLQTSSLGRSIPQALFEVGQRGPEELRPGFEAAHREWLLTTDLGRTITVLKHHLADPC